MHKSEVDSLLEVVVYMTSKWGKGINVRNNLLAISWIIQNTKTILTGLSIYSVAASLPVCM